MNYYSNNYIQRNDMSNKDLFEDVLLLMGIGFPFYTKSKIFINILKILLIWKMFSIALSLWLKYGTKEHFVFSIFQTGDFLQFFEYFSNWFNLFFPIIYIWYIANFLFRNLHTYTYHEQKKLKEVFHFAPIILSAAWFMLIIFKYPAPISFYSYDKNFANGQVYDDMFIWVTAVTDSETCQNAFNGKEVLLEGKLVYGNRYFKISSDALIAEIKFRNENHCIANRLPPFPQTIEKIPGFFKALFEELSKKETFFEDRMLQNARFAEGFKKILPSASLVK